MEETMRTYYMTSHTSNSTDQLDVGQITVQTHDKRNCENVSLLTVHAAKPEYPAAYSTFKPDDFNSYPLSVAYMRQWSGSSLF